MFFTVVQSDTAAIVFDARRFLVFYWEPHAILLSLSLSAGGGVALRRVH